MYLMEFHFEHNNIGILLLQIKLTRGNVTISLISTGRLTNYQCFYFSHLSANYSKNYLYYTVSVYVTLGMLHVPDVVCYSFRKTKYQ